MSRFPEFLKNIVVPERNVLEKWGIPIEGELEGAYITHLRTPRGSPRKHGSEGTMVFSYLAYHLL